ncbi:MAG TPA: hypothetical protein VKI45_11670, partial [Allosphingosinicella sp.]|nr:hypothetical protein [Allosphingosinicella sp.]
RQTVIVVDEASIRRSDAAGFRTANPGVLEAILAVSDPVQAVESGALEPRERVTLLLAPKDGTQPRAMFTGCAPALSAEDKAKAEAGSSSAQRAKDSFFATGAANRIADQAEEFRTTLLGAVQHIAEGAPEQQGRAAPSFEASSAVRSLKTAARVADPSLGAPRLVLIAPAALRAVPAAADPASARQAGFAAARATRVDLGQSEVAVALADGRSRDFVEAFLLGSRGRLISWSSGPPSNLAPAPVAVRSFAGTIEYGSEQFPVRARLAYDRKGALVNSWIQVLNQQEAATPLSGNAVCDSNSDCTITGDGRSFSQSWSAKQAGMPEFGSDIPFSGLRYFDIRIAGNRASGRIYDPLVAQIGDDPQRKELRFAMTETGI